MASQLVVLAHKEEGGSTSGDGLPAIAARSDLVRDLAKCNTTPEREGEDILYGPGVRFELSPGQDPVTQMLLTIDDEDIGWMTIMRMARQFKWKLLDPVSGRELMPR